MTRIWWIAAIVVVLGTFAASAAIYPKLDDRVPTHWNIKGEIDGYGSKTWATFLMPGSMLGLLGVLVGLPYITPKSLSVEPFRKTYAFIACLVMCLLAYLHALTLSAAMGYALDIGRSMMGAMFVFFILIGNVMGKVTRNPYVGIRVAWTLASERVWNATHRFGGKVFVIAGVVGLLLMLLHAPLWVAIVVLVFAAIVPIGYSWWISFEEEPAKG